MKRILVTGGAGYIGSHLVAALNEKGFEVLVYDNLSTGHRDAVLSGRLVVGDLNDLALLSKSIQGFKPDAVMHFAAFIQVGESVKEPLKYYENNAVNAVNLLKMMTNHGVDKFIFSSTAAVYGHPKNIPIAESEPIQPINPYGSSKAFVEAILKDMESAYGMRSVSLRYFNAAGADPLARLGERHDPETHLIPLVLRAAAGERKEIAIHGTDYDTPDGTCIRDYIHVEDLVDAHLCALQYLLEGNPSDAFNCGYGHGYSVREVINVARAVTGGDFPIRESARREGDSPVLIADNAKIKQKLNWIPRHDDLEYIVRTACEWEKKNASRRSF